MKSSILLIVLIVLTSCHQDKKNSAANLNPPKKSADTLVVKHKDSLNKSLIGLFSKSYSYYWIFEKDTLDFRLNATEYGKDSTLHLRVFHKNLILFKTVLSNINECITLIVQDFDKTKFSSIFFESPIYYLDLAKELSTEYEHNFGRKNISYTELNQFLLKSTLNMKLDNFLNPLDKKVKRYSIEKFHLLDKKYYSSYFPSIDFKEYPEFTIEGNGVSVQLENK
jgi:hypothetical protein